MRPDRASPRGHRPPRSRVPRSPGNDRAPLRLPVVATAATVVAAAAAAWEGGCGPPGSASLPAPGRAGQRRLRLLLRLLPALPRLMPGPGCRSPGATRAPLRACALMARRGRRSALMRRGSHRSPSRAGPAPGSPRPLRASAASPLAHPALATCALRPRAPQASPAPRSPGCPLRPREIAHLRPRSCTPGPRPGPCRPRLPRAALSRPASPPRLLLSPRPRAQPQAPSPTRRAGELCRAAAAAAAAHYHRPARAAAALKWRRQPHRRRWAPPSAFPTEALGFSLSKTTPRPSVPDPYHLLEELTIRSQTDNDNNDGTILSMLRGFQNILKGSQQPSARLTASQPAGCC